MTVTTAPEKTHNSARIRLQFAGLLLLPCVLIGVIGWWYQNWQRREFTEAAQRRLQSIADLKVAQIASWRATRVHDAEYLRMSGKIAELAAAIDVPPGDEHSRSGLHELLALLQTSSRFDQIVYFGRNGAPLFSIPQEPLLASERTRAAVRIVMQTQMPMSRDLQRDEASGECYMDLLEPIRSPERTPDAPALGVILLRNYASQYLYPLVQSWPVDSPTAETLLARKEGARVLFLNTLRHAQHPPMTFSVPIRESPNTPAVMAVAGRRGVVEGLDYRGTEVLAALAEVPGTPWIMVSKVDAAEVYAPLARQAWLTWGLVGLFEAAACLCALLLWSRNDRSYLQKQLELQREREMLSSRLLALTEGTDDIIVLTDGGMRITEANHRAKTLFDLTDPAQHPRPLSELILPEFRPRLATNAMELISNRQESQTFNAILIRSDGTTFPADLTLARLLAGERMYYQCVIRDCTERMQTTEALRRSEEKLRAFFRSGVIGTVMGNVHGGLHYVNDEFLRICGYPREDVLSGKVNWREMTAPEYRQLDLLHIKEAQRRGSCSPYEKQYIRPDGSRIWVLVGFVALGDKREDTVAFVLDISEHKATEKELRRVHDVLQTTQQLGKVGSWEYDIGRSVTWASEETYRIFRVPPQEGYVNGDYFTQDIIHPEQVLTDLQRLANGEADSYVTEFRLRAAGEHPEAVILSMARLMRDENGKPQRVLGFSQDITERKNADDEIRKLNTELTAINRELENRVHLRTKELEERNQALIQSNRRVLALSADLRANNQQLERTASSLKAANHELEAFSYSVSHDLRAPLRALDGFSLALLEDYSSALDEQGRRYLERLRAGAQRMGRLIDDLLSLSRVTRSEMNLGEVDLSQLAQEVVTGLRELEPERAVEVLIEPNMHIRGDRALLQVALENLLGNAWKFSRPAAQARIEFFRDPTEHPQPSQPEATAERTTFCIRDNGAGFDMQYSDKLFNAFQRVHSTKEFEGTGIGLATVRRIIARHAGVIWARAEVGKGAAFYFALPETSAAQPQQENAAEQTSLP